MHDALRAVETILAAAVWLGTQLTQAIQWALAWCDAHLPSAWDRYVHQALAWCSQQLHSVWSMAFATAAGLVSLQSCSAGALSQLGSRAAAAVLDARLARSLRRGSSLASLDADGSFLDSAQTPFLTIDDEPTALRPLGGKR